MNRTLRVTCLLLVSMLSQVIGCGLEGLLGVEQPAEETWNPVYTPVSSVGLLLQGAPNGPSNAALKATSGTVVIDTDAVTITVGGTVHPGTVRTQADGPEVAEFTFDSIHLASGVTVTTKGNRVLSLVAHGDVVIDTTLDVSGEDGRAGGNRPAGRRARRQSPCGADYGRKLYDTRRGRPGEGRRDTGVKSHPGRRRVRWGWGMDYQFPQQDWRCRIWESGLGSGGRQRGRLALHQNN